jgi:hypothetical protein
MWAISVLRDGDEVYSAVWMNLVHPVGIKICYLKAGAPVRESAAFSRSLSLTYLC